MLLFVSTVGATTLSYAPASLLKEIPEDRHYLFLASYLLCLTGLMGISITGDLFNVFVFLRSHRSPPTRSSPWEAIGGR